MRLVVASGGRGGLLGRQSGADGRDGEVLGAFVEFATRDAGEEGDGEGNKDESSSCALLPEISRCGSVDAQRLIFSKMDGAAGAVTKRESGGRGAGPLWASEGKKRGPKAGIEPGAKGKKGEMKAGGRALVGSLGRGCKW